MEGLMKGVRMEEGWVRGAARGPEETRVERTEGQVLGS